MENTFPSVWYCECETTLRQFFRAEESTISVVIIKSCHRYGQDFCQNVSKHIGPNYVLPCKIEKRLMRNSTSWCPIWLLSNWQHDVVSDVQVKHAS